MTTAEEKLDIIAFGAHPDDVEIGAGGFLAKEAALGYKIGIVDMTRGEMGTNGTPEIRAEEGDQAAKILGASWRKSMAFPDGMVTADHESVMKVARLLRIHRPSIILAPYREDRHPDHVNTSNLVTEAHFKAGLRKLEPEVPAFRPRILMYYFLNKMDEFSFIIDTSAHHATKMESIDAHYSQFGGRGLKHFELLGVRKPLQLIESRNKLYGAQIGTEYGEAFLINTPVPIEDPMKIWGI